MRKYFLFPFLKLFFSFVLERAGMVICGNQQEDEEKNPISFSRGATRSWGTTISGQSISTSGSAGSPSSRSEPTMVPPAVCDNTSVQLNQMDSQGDDAVSQGAFG